MGEFDEDLGSARRLLPRVGFRPIGLFEHLSRWASYRRTSAACMTPLPTRRTSLMLVPCEKAIVYSWYSCQLVVLGLVSLTIL